MNREDALCLLEIKQKHAYLDRKSKERFTNEIKPKYKLTGNTLPSLGEYFFLVLTKHSSSCKPYFTFTIKREDWENKKTAKHLSEPFSYCDLRRHYEWLTEKELLAKIKDIENGFRYAAKLSDIKFLELKLLKDKINLSPDVSDETKNLISFRPETLT